MPSLVGDEEEMEVCSALLDLSSTMEISCGSNVRPQLQWGSKRRRNSTATAATITATTTTCVTQQHQGEEEEEEEDRRDEGEQKASSAIQQAEANTNRKPKGIRKKKAYNELKALTAGLLAEQEQLNSGILEARVLYEQLRAQNHARKTEECSPMNERLHWPVESEGSLQPHATTEPNSTLSQLSVIDHLRGRHQTDDSCVVESRLLLVHPGITSSGTKGLKAIPSTTSYGSFRSNEMNIVAWKLRTGLLLLPRQGKGG